MVGRERELAECGEGQVGACPAGEGAEEGVVGVERGGALWEEEARVGEVVGGGEGGEEGGVVRGGGEAARDEEVRVELAEVGGIRGDGREQRGGVAERHEAARERRHLDLVGL